MADPRPDVTAADAPALDTSVDLDGISLEQALLDFEVANARVIDLTKRLTTLSSELRRTSTDLQKTRLRNRALQTELDTVKASSAYRSARTASRVARGVRSRLRK